jgi:hypothetical protein
MGLLQEMHGITLSDADFDRYCARYRAECRKLQTKRDNSLYDSEYQIYDDALKNAYQEFRKFTNEHMDDYYKKENEN